MIEVFHKDDLRAFVPNPYSDPSDVMFAINSRDWLKWSLKDAGKVEAIIMASEYHSRCYVAFFLIAKDFRRRNAVKLKDFVHSTKESLNVLRIQTDSLDDAVLNGWHKYLGFTMEGVRKKMLFGKDYRSWALVFEE